MNILRIVEKNNVLSYQTEMGFSRKKLYPLLIMSIFLKLTPWISNQIYREPHGIFHFFTLTPWKSMFFFNYWCTPWNSNAFYCTPWIFCLTPPSNREGLQCFFLEKSNISKHKQKIFFTIFYLDVPSFVFL